MYLVFCILKWGRFDFFLRGIFYSVETTDRCRADLSKEIEGILSFDGKKTDRFHPVCLRAQTRLALTIADRLGLS